MPPMIEPPAAGSGRSRSRSAEPHRAHAEGGAVSRRPRARCQTHVARTPATISPSSVAERLGRRQVALPDGLDLATVMGSAPVSAPGRRTSSTCPAPVRSTAGPPRRSRVQRLDRPSQRDHGATNATRWKYSALPQSTPATAIRSRRRASRRCHQNVSPPGIANASPPRIDRIASSADPRGTGTRWPPAYREDPLAEADQRGDRTAEEPVRRRPPRPRSSSSARSRTPPCRRTAGDAKRPARLPLAVLEAGLQRPDLQTVHRLPEPVRHLREDLGVLVVRRGLHDRAGARRRVLGLKMPEPRTRRRRRAASSSRHRPGRGPRRRSSRPGAVPAPRPSGRGRPARPAPSPS